MPDSAVSAACSGSLDKCFYSFAPSPSITARLLPRLPTAPPPFPSGDAWTASAAGARWKGRSLARNASGGCLVLTVLSSSNDQPKPRARLHAPHHALWRQTRKRFCMKPVNLDFHADYNFSFC